MTRLAILSALLSAPALADVRVVDGDTIDIDGERVRLCCIDAPELHARCPAEQALAEAARSRLQALIASGRPLVAEIARGRQRGRYERWLARVYAGGVDVGNVLLAEGLARHYAGGKRAGWCG